MAVTKAISIPMTLTPVICYDSLDFYFPFFFIDIDLLKWKNTHFSWEKLCLNAWVRKKDEYYDFWFFTRSTRPKFIKFGSSINREKSNLEKREDTNSHFCGEESFLSPKRIHGEVQKNGTTDSCTTHSSVYVPTSMAISNRNFSNDSSCKRYNLLLK